MRTAEYKSQGCTVSPAKLFGWAILKTTVRRYWRLSEQPREKTLFTEVRCPIASAIPCPSYTVSYEFAAYFPPAHKTKCDHKLANRDVLEMYSGLWCKQQSVWSGRKNDMQYCSDCLSRSFSTQAGPLWPFRLYIWTVADQYTQLQDSDARRLQRGVKNKKKNEVLLVSYWETAFWRIEEDHSRGISLLYRA